MMTLAGSGVMAQNLLRVTNCSNPLSFTMTLKTQVQKAPRPIPTDTAAVATNREEMEHHSVAEA